MDKKIALVTGGSRGIGKCIAEVLVMAGYDVYISARTEVTLKNACREIAAKGYFVSDLTTEGACDKLISQLIDVEGKIDILVNNAGDYVYSPVESVSDVDIDKLINLNIKSPYLLIKAVAKHMKQNKWGRIVNIGSISGVVGEANASLYSMTKSSYIGLTKALALELATDNITINTINPGWVNTDLAENAVESSDFTYQEEIDMIPQRRFIEPIEVANLVKYIVSDEAKGMTGQSVNLCAGLSVG